MILWLIKTFKDRYYGGNDPVALKLLDRAKNMPSIEPPEDKSITTLFVGGLDEGKNRTRTSLECILFIWRNQKSSMYPNREVAFVQFTKRTDAETAVDKKSLTN